MAQAHISIGNLPLIVHDGRAEPGTHVATIELPEVKLVGGKTDSITLTPRQLADGLLDHRFVVERDPSPAKPHSSAADPVNKFPVETPTDESVVTDE